MDSANPEPISESAVADFLFHFKFTAQSSCGYTFWEREKNMQTLAELNLSIEDALEVIYQLTPRDYCSGPEPDRDYRNQRVWKFGCNIDGQEIYVKLADDYRHKAKIISFHKAERPIQYPFRREEIESHVSDNLREDADEKE